MGTSELIEYFGLDLVVGYTLEPKYPDGSGPQVVVVDRICSNSDPSGTDISAIFTDEFIEHIADLVDEQLTERASGPDPMDLAKEELP